MSTADRDWLAERFQRERPHLRAVAYRMLGSVSEADDALQNRGYGSATSVPGASGMSTPG